MDALSGAVAPSAARFPGDTLVHVPLPDSLMTATAAPAAGWPWVALAVAAGVVLSWLLYSRRAS